MANGFALLLCSLLFALLSAVMGSPSAPPTMPGDFKVASAGPMAPPSGPSEMADSEIASAAPSAPPADEEDDDDDDEEAEVAKVADAGKTLLKNLRNKLTPSQQITRAQEVVSESEKKSADTTSPETASSKTDSVTLSMLAVYLIVGGAATACLAAIAIALLVRYCKRTGQVDKNVSEITVRVTETRA